MADQSVTCPDCGTMLWDLERRLELHDRSHRHHPSDCVKVLKAEVDRVRGLFHDESITLRKALHRIVDETQIWCGYVVTPSAKITIETMVRVGDVARGALADKNELAPCAPEET